ncbi:TetR/AcrR family transcriptional regulator [Cellulomonas sp. NS3]|uniref:TetR/AcrR family transcriptional regulator n=1 Tax=Cellulomonas sp. NS3 TaxID=2973977 RepID=UPI00216371CF|nr:TetR/AcrR family transcriptional regulator [Cellulomonas sp. NS3]
MAVHQEETPRKPRADAERNRLHILDVAEGFFAEHGVSGAMQDIATRAGLGPGTLYRHFPTRESLLAALLQARWEELDARRAAIEAEQSDPLAALELWLTALGDYVTVFDGLPGPLREALRETTSPLAITCEWLVEFTGQFLSAAQAAGCARPWARDRDLVLTVLASAWVSDAQLADTRSGDSLRALVREGWHMPPATGSSSRSS